MDVEVPQRRQLEHRLIKFEYTDTAGTYPELTPLRSNPGVVFGGWAAFTAVLSPRIQIIKVSHQ